MGFFDGVAGGLTGGILSYLGQEETNRSNKQNQQAAQDFSSDQAKQTRDWEEHMSNTAYQRAVQDMQAAGLNPMLAYQRGGASTPSGATGMAFQAQVGNSLGAAVEGFNSSRSSSADVGQKESQTSVNEEEVKVRRAMENKVQQDTATSAAQESSAKADAVQKLSQARLNSANEAKTRAETGYIDAQRAELSAKQPLWNIGRSVTQKMEDISNASTAENVKRAADTVRYMRFHGQRENPRSITIYGDSK